MAANYSTKNKILIGLGVFVVFIIICALFKQHSYGGYGPEGRNTRPEISVNGTGEVVAIPDIATFNFSVIETAKTVKEAQDKASAKMNKVLAFLKNSNIADKDVKTQDYSINPRYDYQTVACLPNRACPPGKQVLTGYEVSQTIQVKVRDTAQAGTILSGIGGLEVQNVSGISLTIDNDQVVLGEARTKAIADAKAKAQELAKQLGVKLVRITGFSEQGSSPIYFGKTMLQSNSAAGDAAMVPPLPTGENKITSNVTITYEIR